MKKMRIFVVLLALVLVFSSWAPALATNAVNTNPQSAAAASTGPLTLTIKNPLPKATTVTLTGPKTYNIYVNAGATLTKTIDAGRYKYTYAGCFGKMQKGNLKVKGTTADLKITACKMANWRFTNFTSSYVSIRMKGWVNYFVSIAPGQTVKVSWVSGTYQATLKFCGKSVDTAWKVSGNKGWYFPPCK